jgi:hypothetical protein
MSLAAGQLNPQIPSAFDQDVMRVLNLINASSHSTGVINLARSEYQKLSSIRAQPLLNASR